MEALKICGILPNFLPRVPEGLEKLLLMAEIRRAPVEVGSWNPIIYRVSAPSKRWLFGISAINSRKFRRESHPLLGTSPYPIQTHDFESMILLFPKGGRWTCSLEGTLPETNVRKFAPENGWLEYSFPFGAFRPIFRGYVSSLEGKNGSSKLMRCVGWLLKRWKVRSSHVWVCIYVCVCMYIYISIFTRTPRTNIFAPVNWPKPKRKVVFQPSIFRCYVSFRGCIYIYICIDWLYNSLSLSVDISVKHGPLGKMQACRCSNIYIYIYYIYIHACIYQPLCTLKQLSEPCQKKNVYVILSICSFLLYTCFSLSFLSCSLSLLFLAWLYSRQHSFLNVTSPFFASIP